MHEDALVIGKPYFAQMYADEQLRLPEVQPLIYLGRDDQLHQFQYAWSYLKHGNWLTMTTDQRKEYREPPVIHFDVGQVEPICDADGLVDQLRAWHGRLSK